MLDEGFDPTIIRTPPVFKSYDIDDNRFRSSIITVSLPNGDKQQIELHQTGFFHYSVVARRVTICWEAPRAGGAVGILW